MSLFLVTGGAGFIGSHTVERLLDEGHRVRVVDNFSTGRRDNLSHLLGHPCLEIAEGDICDEELVGQVMDGVDFVIHLAAIPSVPRSVADPFSSYRVNVEGTLKVLASAKDEGVGRVVLASSSSIYGGLDEGRNSFRAKKESTPPRPLSPYAATKLAAEGLCRAFFHSYGLETVALRYFNVFGPRQDPTSQYASVVPRFASALLKGEKPTIYGDGHQTRDFTYVSNVVEANLLACNARGAEGGVFNVACGRSMSVLKLLEMMARELNVKVEPEFAPPRPGDVRYSRADISLAQKVLGYEVRVDLEEGIKKTLDYMRQLNHA